MRSLTILGATGSIGASTLDLIRRNPDDWRVVALTAKGQAAELAAFLYGVVPGTAPAATPEGALSP